MTDKIDPHSFYWPEELSRTPTTLKRVLLIGTCREEPMAEIFTNIPQIGCPTDIELFYHTRILPAHPPHSVDSYDFQVLFPPLRRVLPETSYFRLDDSDESAFQILLTECEERLEQFLDAMLRYNAEHGLLSFVCNFVVPMQNYRGRLLPRYDLRNIQYFVETLNKSLAALLTKHRNVYLLDFDGVVASFGRSTFQSDVLWASNVGGPLVDFDFAEDAGRLEKTPPASQIYPSLAYDYLIFMWRELCAMYRTIRQIDMVKLVIVDLDDTLWRGLAGERTDGFFDAMEGWPLGMIEALGWLKRRGILLAIVSKNDEAKIAEIWPLLIDDRRLSLEDFAIRKINWLPKAENIEDIFAVLNLLPRNAVFIDDNPVERAAVVQAFPDIRSFGPTPYVWRRILMWAPETQVAMISAESAQRTAMVKGQVERESQRRRVSRAEFLATLAVSMRFYVIADAASPHFARALELINKSNQFNTTGRRWTAQEFSAFFAGGGSIVTFEVADKFTAYGNVGCIILSGETILQFVMSCRVVGLEVEIAALGYIIALCAARGATQVQAIFTSTGANGLCNYLYKNCGFVDGETPEEWVRPVKPGLDRPAHISVAAA